MASIAVDLAGLDGDPVRVGPADLEDLEARLEGSLLWAGDPGWDDAILIWNGMVATTPALVVQPRSPADVSTTIRFAHRHGVALSVKGGGHNIAGTSMVAGGVTLDMSRMREVQLDLDAAVVHVGPGCQLKHVDEVTQQHGLATVLGFVSETGVAGLTVGGGFGYLTRRFGYTVDNLEEVEIVTADGAVLTANRDENADLFWGVRGGGGNLGVVTRFSFRVHRVGPMVTGGLIVWSGERVDEVLATYRDVTRSAPRELTIAATVRKAPPAPFVPVEWHGRPIVGFLLCHTGRDPEVDLEPIRALGDPIVDLIAEKPYVAQQSMMDATQPKGLHYYWKTEYLATLHDDFLTAFSANAVAVTSPLAQSLLFHVGGALNDHAHDDGAVGNRDVHYIGGFAGAWTPEMAPEEHVAWVRNGWDRIRPFSTGGNYLNFQLAEDDESRTAAAYGKNLPRLQELKRRYDPDNLFRANRNVSPAA